MTSNNARMPRNTGKQAADGASRHGHTRCHNSGNNTRPHALSGQEALIVALQCCTGALKHSSASAHTRHIGDLDAARRLP
jgi:hypothetical protein